MLVVLFFIVGDLSSAEYNIMLNNNENFHPSLLGFLKFYCKIAELINQKFIINIRMPDLTNQAWRK